MKLLLVTDAWHPQVSGVVRTLERTIEILERDYGVVCTIISPDQFKSVPVPGEPGMRFAIAGRRALERRLDGINFDHIHVVTEGPLGWAARGFAVHHGLRYTTAFHTQFAEYLKERYRLPLKVTYSFLRRFHGTAAQTLVTTPTMKARLAARGFDRLTLWTRGVDTDLFNPHVPLPDKSIWQNWPRPFLVNVGRIAPEKNLEAFLNLDRPGTKIIVGDGPARSSLSAKYPDAHFVGPKVGEELAAWYRLADAMVFPSRTDTFGLVNVEALACGVPVAAYPVEGPMDIIEDTISGGLNEDLGTAINTALECDPLACRARAEQFNWKAATEQFQAALINYRTR